MDIIELLIEGHIIELAFLMRDRHANDELKKKLLVIHFSLSVRKFCESMRFSIVAGGEPRLTYY